MPQIKVSTTKAEKSSQAKQLARDIFKRIETAEAKVGIVAKQATGLQKTLDKEIAARVAENVRLTKTIEKQQEEFNDFRGNHQKVISFQREQIERLGDRVDNAHARATHALVLAVIAGILAGMALASLMGLK